MTGRPLCTAAEAAWQGFGEEAHATRQRVLRDTINAFESDLPIGHFQRCASTNLTRWGRTAPPPTLRLAVQVLPGDWGEVALELTQLHGVCFAVLNMANAYVPGGAYVEGAGAQEENMFRRTDCHFHIGPEEYDAATDRYWPAMIRRLSGKDGEVFLDTRSWRVCIRGEEDRAAMDLGYRWLPDDQIFPFYELRAAAQDLRGGRRFDFNDARRRIAAQLDTLRAHHIRHAVLGASGCGAFRNPPREIARLYQQEIAARREDFSVIAFAVLDRGHGSDNFTIFREVFSDSRAE